MSKTPKGQIAREGSVSFGDASLAVWEEGIPREWDLKDKWEAKFKREVFSRIVQTLNRLGWTCVVPEGYIKQYSRSFAENHRDCSKGDLKGFLEIGGRHIEFKMWQGVNTPTRPDHGGQYESNKEGCMPYVLRLEMERTRRRIRDYLCAVFADYTFEQKKRSIYRKPLERTAMEHIQQNYAESSHFKGVDFDGYKAKNYGLPGNLKSSDGVELTHGQRVWTTDQHGRWVEGTAYYNINNMWWVLLGRYDYTNKACFDLRATPPENLRAKQNDRLRRKRLESLLAQAVKAMNYERAAVLRDILFPKREPLFVIQNKEGLYFAPNYSGYRDNLVDAGKYTEAELNPYASDIKCGALRAVPIPA